MSPPPDFAERVFEARTASTRRLWFAGAALFTAAAAITTLVIMRQPAPPSIPVTGNIPAPTPALVPAPAPAVAPPTQIPAPVAPTVSLPRKIAILGIEPLRGATQRQLAAADLQVATELTQDLRARAKAGSGPYELGASTERELIDEKLLTNCETEAPACMAAIGHNLAVDVLMFGKLERIGAEYRVSLKLLDVNKKKLVRTLTRPIPIADASGTGLASAAKRMYGDLTGQ